MVDTHRNKIEPRSVDWLAMVDAGFILNPGDFEEIIDHYNSRWTRLIPFVEKSSFAVDGSETPVVVKFTGETLPPYLPVIGLVTLTLTMLWAAGDGKYNLSEFAGGAALDPGITIVQGNRSAGSEISFGGIIQTNADLLGYAGPELGSVIQDTEDAKTYMLSVDYPLSRYIVNRGSGLFLFRPWEEYLGIKVSEDLGAYGTLDVIYSGHYIVPLLVPDEAP